MNNMVARSEILDMIQDMCRKPGMYGLKSIRDLNISIYPLCYLAYVGSGLFSNNEFRNIPEINEMFFSNKDYSLCGNLPEEDMAAIGKTHLKALVVVEEASEKKKLK